jgi:hypothetical protein
MSKRWNVLIQVLIVSTALCGAIYAACAPANNLLNWYNLDDAFYYYKVAQNVLAGHGFTFDGLNFTNGFHPLWMLVCLGVFWFSKFGLILPLRLLILLSGVFNAGASLLLYHLLRRYLHPLAAIAAAFFYALFPSIYSTTTVHGMESVISAFFIILLLYVATETLAKAGDRIPFKRMLLLGLIAALTVLARLDNVFLVVCIGFFVLLRIKRIPVALFYDWLALILTMLLSFILRLGFAGVDQALYPLYPMIVLAVVINPIVYYFAGMYQGFAQRGILSRILRQAIAAIVSTGLIYGVASGLYRLGLLNMISKSVILLFGLIAFVFTLCLRLPQLKSEHPLIPEPFHNFAAWFRRVWKSLLIEGVGFSIPILSLIGGYCLANKHFLGTLTPVSGQIKVWWGTLPNTVYGHTISLVDTLGLSSGSNFGPWSLITSRIVDLSNLLLRLAHSQLKANEFLFALLCLAFFTLIIILLQTRNRRLGLLFFKTAGPALLLGCLLQIAYYHTIGYAHTRSWYWVPEMITMVLLLAVILDELFTWLEQVLDQNWSILLLVTFACLLFMGNMRYVIDFIPPTVTQNNENAYLEEAYELEWHTDKGNKIGMTGGGMVAYFIQDRTIVNLDGLINSPKYFSAMKNGQASQFLDQLGLDYVFGNEYMIEESDPYKSFLSSHVKKLGQLPGIDRFTLYQYVIQE